MLATASSAPARRAQKTGEIYVQGERGSRSSSLSRVTWAESRRPRVYQGRRPSKFPVCVSSASSRPAFPTDQSPRKACSSDPVEALRPASWSGRSQQVAGPSQPVTGGLGLGAELPPTSGSASPAPPCSPHLLCLALLTPHRMKRPLCRGPGAARGPRGQSGPPLEGSSRLPRARALRSQRRFPVRPCPSAPSRIVLARAP